MRSYGFALLALVGLAALGIGLLAFRPASNVSAPISTTQRAPSERTDPASGLDDYSAPAAPTSDSEAQKETPVPTQEPANPPRAPLAIKPGQAIPQMFPFESERKHLMNLAASGDSSTIPAIAAALRHADANVRETARQALIQTGNPAAIPHLKAAEAATRDPAEQELLRESIEFLSLPTLMDVITVNSPSVASP